MNKLITKLATITLFGLFGATAQANTTYLSAKDVKLTCTTPSTCGNYTATHDLLVKYMSGEAKLWWNLNVPAGIADGRYKAHTKGAACPAGSVLSHMTAEWKLDRYLRPQTATAIHCDGVTTSEFDVTMRDIDIPNPRDPFNF